MKNLDLISGIILLAAGVAVFMQSLSYPIGTFRTPGAGLFPLIASVLLFGLSAALMIQAMLPKGRAIASVPFFADRGLPANCLGISGNDRVSLSPSGHRFRPVYRCFHLVSG